MAGKVKKVIKEMVFLSTRRAVAVVICVFGLLALSFYFQLEQGQFSFLAYIIYALSCYGLFETCILLKRAICAASDAFYHTKLIQKIKGHPIGGRLLEDIMFRGQVTLYKGFFMNLLFAGFKLVMSWIYQSVWFGAVAVYYLSLCAIRLWLIRGVKKSTALEGSKERRIEEWHSYKSCGWFMFGLNMALVGMTIQMIWQDKGYSYPGIVIYIHAFYAFYSMTMSAIGLIKSRKLHSPVLSASKALGFAGALMSIYALQTALLAEFGKYDGGFRQLMNTLTGAAVCLIVFAMAVYMVVKGRKWKRRVAVENE